MYEYVYFCNMLHYCILEHDKLYFNKYAVLILYEIIIKNRNNKNDLFKEIYNFYYDVIYNYNLHLKISEESKSFLINYLKSY